MNPLQHYFRRPSLYFVLPSGKNSYPETVVRHTESGELAVYPLTARDEMRLKTPDALMNGEAMVEVIHSCIPDILDPWQINTIDWEAVMIAVRAASNGNTMDINSQCQECNEENTFEVNLAQLLSQQRNIDYSQTLKIRDLEICFRPLTYREINASNLEQYDIQRSMANLTAVETDPEQQKIMAQAIDRMNAIVNNIIADTIAYIRTPQDTVNNPEYIREFMMSCDSKTNQAIQARSIELRQQNELKPLKIKCPKCSHGYEQRLLINATDFFG